MKFIIKIFTISVVVAICQAKIHEKVETKLAKTAGCENYKDFKDLSPKTCCQSYPVLIFNPQVKTCKESCAADKEKICCMANCAFKENDLLNANGTLDNDKVIALLSKRVQNDAEWIKVIKSSVDMCSKEAPALLAKLREIDNKSFACDSALNVAMKRCIMRNLFFNCPVKASKDICTKYQDFGSSCILFPFFNTKNQVGKKVNHQKKEKVTKST